MKVQVEDLFPKGEGQVVSKEDEAKEWYKFLSHSLNSLN